MDSNPFGLPLRHTLPWAIPAALTLATVAVVGLAGSAAYSYQKRLVTARTLEHLKSQSYAKKDVIASWLLDCQVDLKRLSADPRVTPLASGRAGWDRLSPEGRDAVKAALEGFAARHGFEGGVLVDEGGRRLPDSLIGETHAIAPLNSRLAKPLAGATYTARFLPSRDHGVCLELGVRVVPSSSADQVGALFVLNPWRRLFPALTMPDSYLPTSETLLLQREGDRATIVNPTRCAAHAPLTLSLPLGPDGMNSQALQGWSVQGDDRDYRGAPVLYATQYVPLTGWGVVVKADQRDVYATMEVTALLVWGLVLASFLAIGHLSYAWWNRRHKALLDDFSALGVRYRTLVESAHEGIWVWDLEGLTVFANPRLAQMLRCTQQDLARRPVTQFLGPEESDRAPFGKGPGRPFLGEEHEVRLVRADGTDLWVILSLSGLSGPDGILRGSLGLLTDVTDRRRAENERAQLLDTLDRKKTDLQRLLQELLVTQEKERRHLSHELHDELVQLLTAADSYMQGIENGLAPGGDSPSRSLLDKARTQIGKAGALCRRLIQEMRPPDLERLGLAGALSALLKGLDVPRARMVVTGDEALQALTWEGQAVLFRVAQEAFQNIRKHARAEEVEVSLDGTEAAVRLRIRDYGRGFDPASAALPNHFGLLGMRERVELAGGSLAVVSRPGAGATVDACLPLARQEVRLKVIEGGASGLTVPEGNGSAGPVDRDAGPDREKRT